LFSSSFTLGEAVLVLQTMALAMADILLVTLVKVRLMADDDYGDGNNGDGALPAGLLWCALAGQEYAELP